MAVAELLPSEISHLQGVSTEMSVASTRVVLAGHEGGLGNVVVKGDRSLLSAVDPESERAAKEIWLARTNYPILGEESGVSHGTEEAVIPLSEVKDRILGVKDPIDGSRPYVNGAHTSTVMGGSYDMWLRHFVTSTVIHPTSGTVVEASGGRTHTGQLELLPGDAFEISGWREPEAWDGPLEGSTVLVDNFAPFERTNQDGSKRVITNKDRLLRFQTGLLDQGAVPQGYGSNGYHQLLLARGGQKLAGAVMLSQGGPWDAIGMPAVENAGGKAYAFAVLESGRLVEVHSPDPFIWDILVLGSTAVNADRLAGIVERMFR